MNTVILLAAGGGQRMEGVVADKILAPLGGRPVFLYSVRSFLAADIAGAFTVVYRDPEQRRQLERILGRTETKRSRFTWIFGGAERRDSVIRALRAQPPGTEYVFIHDCARPLVSPESIRKLDTAVNRDGAAVLARPVTDTIKRVPAGAPPERAELEDLDRSRLWATETPQAFVHSRILHAYEAALREGKKITDDTAAFALQGGKTTLVHNPHPNPKITTPADLDYAEWLLARNGGG